MLNVRSFLFKVFFGIFYIINMIHQPVKNYQGPTTKASMDALTNQQLRSHKWAHITISSSFFFSTSPSYPCVNKLLPPFLEIWNLSLFLSPVPSAQGPPERDVNLSFYPFPPIFFNPIFLIIPSNQNLQSKCLFACSPI